MKSESSCQMQKKIGKWLVDNFSSSFVDVGV
jgi:hypothetical protein